MDKIWLPSYPPGVPPEIDPCEYASLGDLFAQGVRAFAARPAYVNLGRSIDYGELDRLSAAFGAWLQSGLRLPPGARVALMMPNLLQYPIAMFGALRAGYVVVNVNPLYTARELAHQLRDAGVAAIVVLENFCATLQAVLPELPVRHVVVTGVGDLLGPLRGACINFILRHIRKKVPPWQVPGHVRWSQAMAAGARYRLEPARVGRDDVAFIQYSGGTSGTAKGAILTHGNIIANLQQAHAWIRPFLREGEEVIVTALPLYHIFSLTANCLTFFKLGACNVLITNPRDIPRFVAELRRQRFTAITGVNTLFNALLNHPGFARVDFSHLKVALGGGMSVQQSVAQRWHKLTGKPLIEAYGLTEASPAVSINPLDLPEFNRSIGLPIPSTEVSIRDDAGTELPPGQAGELCVRGPQVMRGYWNRPEATAEAFTTDGFLRTGDVVEMDTRGFLRIVDRKKDVILVSGFNVYPNEVEDVVASHPGVSEVAAVGIPDPHSGEVVKVFVVRKDPALTPAALIAHCRKNLTRYKVPHAVEFRDELPKSNVGKVLRRLLRDAAPPAPP